MDPSSRRAIAVARFAALVRAHFGERIRDVRLFGSAARGDSREDSDLDVLVVVDDLTDAEGREIAYLAGDVLTEHGVLVSAFTQSTARWRELGLRERLIVREIERDGVPL
jgi:predicted nucleotidyltransferase